MSTPVSAARASPPLPPASSAPPLSRGHADDPAGAPAGQASVARSSGLLVACAVGLAVATVLPARVALFLEQEGATRWLSFGGGLLTDAALVAPIVTASIATLAWIGVRRPALLRVGAPLLGGLLALSWLGHNAAMEFRIQRGVFPGPVEAREGLGHGDFVLAELPALLGGRFLPGNIVCAALAFALAVVARRQLASSSRAWLRRRAPLAFVCLGVLVSVTLGLGARESSAYGARLHNPGAIGSPARTLMVRLFVAGDYDGSPGAVRKLLVAAPVSPDALALGAAHMGLPPAAGARLALAETHADCMQHPLARPLAEDGTELLDAARGLSRALFRARAVAPIVHHVSLESVRADDVHGLSEDAPASLTPFLTQATRPDTASSASFSSAHQSGVRTAQALSAVVCGVGALPFHLALGRDLGALPLRCLPEVLGDAGFVGRVFYGHELVFDDMGTFLRGRGLRAHERRDFPSGAPRGVWGGVTDGPVYAAALDAAGREARAQYNFVLTLSHHNPYTIPADAPAPVEAAARAVCDARGLGGENCARLHTLAYADDALGRFVAGVEASVDASRTLVVFAADHTTHVWAPWTDAPRVDALTRVPLVVWLPEALRRAADPVAFEPAWARFRELARRRPVSNSDLPSLVLALVGDSEPMKNLPPARRWHTLGGQATSPHFRSPTGEGAVFGIDAHAHPFHVLAPGVVRTGAAPMEALRSRLDVVQARPLDAPAVALWGSFLRGYAAACPRGAP
ncbi:MAG: sulfatase-like hydrolase/transferase [Myxococcales bacterium]|nr:sulfatase-like hydrolase/transferase [Myxococcales bacterium]MBL0198177.1 sulfatase-like hydrolase/transferase [Myxococcales bacterium]